MPPPDYLWTMVTALGTCIRGIATGQISSAVPAFQVVVPTGLVGQISWKSAIGTAGTAATSIWSPEPLWGSKVSVEAFSLSYRLYKQQCQEFVTKFCVQKFGNERASGGSQTKLTDQAQWNHRTSRTVEPISFTCVYSRILIVPRDCHCLHMQRNRKSTIIL